MLPTGLRLIDCEAAGVGKGIRDLGGLYRLGGVLRGRTGDSAMASLSSSGSETSATECRLV